MEEGIEGESEETEELCWLTCVCNLQGCRQLVQ